MLDAILNWILDAVEGALDALPDWTPALPPVDGLVHPLSQINWLVAVEGPFVIGLTLMLLGPIFLTTTLTLWLVGLFTPTSTTR